MNSFNHSRTEHSSDNNATSSNMSTQGSTSSSGATTSNATPSNQPIPLRVKNNIKRWSQGQVRDSDFVSGMQYLVQQEIMKIPPSSSTTVSLSQQIPSWIKTNAGW